MADLIKIKVKKKIDYNNTGKDEFNTVMLNLDNIVDIERINNRIHFTLTGNKERIGEWETAEVAKDFFNKLFNDYFLKSYGR